MMLGIIKSITPKERFILAGSLAVMVLLLIKRGELPLVLTLGLFFIAYIAVAYDVVISAFKTLFIRHRMSEQFLMTIATFGAFALQDYPEALAVMIFYKIGDIFEEYASGKSHEEITSLVKLKPSFARLVKDDGSEEMVKPRKVKIGDVIRVKAGEAIALDGVLLKGYAQVNLAALTGESMPVTFKEGDEIPSGGINLSQVVELKVTRDYRNSSIARLINLIEDAAANKSRPEALITRFAVWYTPIVVACAALLALVPLFISGESWADWTQRALVFLVVSCPCALVLSVPLSFFGGIGAISRIGVMVKGSIFIENLARLKALCFDKTGTITYGKFKVTEFKVKDDKALAYLKALEEQSTHPLAQAAVSFCTEHLKGQSVFKANEVKEIAGFGIEGEIDGHHVVACSKEYAKKLCGTLDLSAQKLGTEIYVVEDHKLLGLFVLFDEVREDAQELFVKLKDLGIATAMITGDKKEVAQVIARELNLSEVYAEQLPDDKLKAFNEIKKHYGLVGYVGDGINDAPVLAASDAGIAMGQFGSASAVEASDVVIMQDELSKIAKTIELSRKTLSLAMQNMIFVILAKLIILILGALGMAGIWLAIVGDVGLCVLAVLNAMRALTWVKNKVDLKELKTAVA